MKQRFNVSAVHAQLLRDAINGPTISDNESTPVVEAPAEVESVVVEPVDVPEVVDPPAAKRSTKG